MASMKFVWLVEYKERRERVWKPMEVYARMSDANVSVMQFAKRNPGCDWRTSRFQGPR